MKIVMCIFSFLLISTSSFAGTLTWPGGSYTFSGPCKPQITYMAPGTNCSDLVVVNSGSTPPKSAQAVLMNGVISVNGKSIANINPSQQQNLLK